MKTSNEKDTRLFSLVSFFSRINHVKLKRGIIKNVTVRNNCLFNNQHKKGAKIKNGSNYS